MEKELAPDWGEIGKCVITGFVMYKPAYMRLGKKGRDNRRNVKEMVRLMHYKLGITIIAVLASISSYGQTEFNPAYPILVEDHSILKIGKGYVQMDGGYNGKEMPFSISAMYQIKPLLARVNYLEQVERDVWAVQIGLCPVWEGATRVLLWYGQEFRPNPQPKVSIEAWRQIEPGIFITAGVGTANDRTYGHIGLALQIVKLQEKKPKRFY